MKVKKIFEAITDISHEREIDRELIVEALKDTILQAAEKKFEQYKQLDVVFDQEEDKIELLRYKSVVDVVIDPDNEISLEEALEFDENAEEGDQLIYEIESEEFIEILGQTARRILFGKINEIERENIAQKYSSKVGEIVFGTVGRVERNYAAIMLGNRTEAILPRREQIPNEKFQPGESIRALLLEIQEGERGSQLLISRSHPDFLIKLFEVEVPEVFEKTVIIEKAVREAGRKAKIAVYSIDPDIDPVGACVGLGGSRIQAVSRELNNERIDVIELSDDIVTLISRSLQPAKLNEIKVDTANKTAECEVENDQLSLAIGRLGQNARLASQLTSYQISIFATKSGNSDELGDFDLDEALRLSEEKALEQGQSDPVQAEEPAADETAVQTIDSTSSSPIEQINTAFSSEVHANINISNQENLEEKTSGQEEANCDENPSEAATSSIEQGQAGMPSEQETEVTPPVEEVESAIPDSNSDPQARPSVDD